MLHTPPAPGRIYPTCDTVQPGDTLVWAEQVTPEPTFRTETVERLTTTQVVFESGARLNRYLLPRVRVRNESGSFWDTPQAFFADTPDAQDRAVAAVRAHEAVRELAWAIGNSDDSYNAVNVDGITAAYETYISHATAAFK